MDIEITAGLIAAAKVAADHYGDEADYFMREGEEATAGDFANREQQILTTIAAAQAQLTAPNTDPLVAKIEALLDEDATGYVRGALWDLIENTGDSPF